jgi:hypothetical protein
MNASKYGARKLPLPWHEKNSVTKTDFLNPLYAVTFKFRTVEPNLEWQQDNKIKLLVDGTFDRVE